MDQGNCENCDYFGLFILSRKAIFSTFIMWVVILIETPIIYDICKFRNTRRFGNF